MATKYATTVTPENELETKLRSYVLQGLRFDVFQFVKANPGVTREAVARGLGLRAQSATARIKELIDNGFLVEGDTTKNRSGVSAKQLYVVNEAQHRRPPDKVRIEVLLSVDPSGNYHARAQVVDGNTPTGIARVVKRQKITMVAPNPTEYKHLFTKEDFAVVNPVDTVHNRGLIIDAEDYTIE